MEMNVCRPDLVCLCVALEWYREIFYVTKVCVTSPALKKRMAGNQIGK